MNNIQLRLVTNEDCGLLLEWANDIVVRKNSINSNKITLEEHMEWFNRKMNDSMCHMYIMEVGANPVGQVRIDFENNTGKISYSIDKKHRGKGYGQQIIALIENKERSNVKNLYAEVKDTNIVSQNIFMSNNWKNVGEKGDLVIFEKNI